MKHIGFNYIKQNENKREYRKNYLVDRKYPKRYLIIQFLVTIIAWLVAIYFFKDVFIYIFFLFGGYDVREYIPLDILNNLLLYTIISFITITIWIVYNKVMFGGKDRRKNFPEWSKEQVEKLYNINDRQYSVLQKCDILQIGFNDDNKIQEVAGIMSNKQNM